MIQLPEELYSDVKLFADDSSLFSVVSEMQKSAADMKNDLKMINEQADQWKMSFNPDPSKKTQEAILSRKAKTVYCPSIIF